MFLRIHLAELKKWIFQEIEKTSGFVPLVFLYLLGLGIRFGGGKQGRGVVERLCGRAHLARQCASSG